MASRDINTILTGVRAISPVAAYTDNTVINSQIIDTQGFESLNFFVNIGVLSDVDATWAVTLTDGDDSGLSDGAAVASDYIIGNANFTFADDNAIKQIGYVGKKRYVRLTITPTANSGNAYFDVLAVKGNPSSTQIS